MTTAPAITITPADPAGADAQACLHAYFDELRQRLESGFDPGLTVSANPEELIPPAGWFLVARLDGGAAVGCGGVKFKDGVGEVKRMWVSPTARGRGLARRLLKTLEALAAEAGVDVLQLDTSRHLVEARALYARDGYAEIAPYNDNPYADHWYEKRGVQQGRPEIVQASEQDVSAIEHLIGQAYCKYVERIGRPPGPMVEDHARWVREHSVYVLRLAGRVEGSIRLIRDADAIQIDDLAVSPALQGCGYGRMLLGYAERMAQSQGLAAVTLFTNAKMYENIAFYGKYGFEETGRRTEEGFDRVFFRKRLA